MDLIGCRADYTPGVIDVEGIDALLNVGLAEFPSSLSSCHVPEFYCHVPTSGGKYMPIRSILVCTHKPDWHALRTLSSLYRVLCNFIDALITTIQHLGSAICGGGDESVSIGTEAAIQNRYPAMVDLYRPLNRRLLSGCDILGHHPAVAISIPR